LIQPVMQSVTNKPYMVSVIMLNVVVLSAIMVCVVAQYKIFLKTR
jgi:hypothetical protein